MSEPAGAFDARLASFVNVMRVREQDRDCVQVDAGEVYSAGVVAGLSLAVAALQRRERIIDHLARWEARVREHEARRLGR